MSVEANNPRLVVGKHASCCDSEPPEALETTNKCIICDVLEGRDDTPARSFITRTELPSEILASGAGFAAVADVAPLAPGHILLVTKRHILAMNRLTATALGDLNVMRLHCVIGLRSLYSLPVVAFEHGLCRREIRSACGINHAHLHVVPIDTALEKAFREDFEVVKLKHVGEIREVTKQKNEYLLLMTVPDKVLIAFPQRATSQYFRKAISNLTGREFWNWHDEFLLGQTAERRDWILQLHKSWAKHISW
jgi:diadenosine tetraphosphate (Ap4A) HIT family hydrolase